MRSFLFIKIKVVIQIKELKVASFLGILLFLSQF